jgi:L-fuconolactonase
MEIVDMQLHEMAPFEDWSNVDEATRRQVLTESLWQSIDAVGVDAAILNPLEDTVWATELALRFPDRLRTVVMCHRSDVEVPDVEGRIAEMFDQPGVVALRFGALPAFMPQVFGWYAAGGYDPAFAACEEQGIPIWLEIMGGVATADRVARKFPNLQIILDHVGLNQPPYQVKDNPPWKELPIALDLSKYENVAIKVCAPISLSEESYPWADAWQQVARLLDAFGPQRIAWASDITRTRGRTGYTNRLVSHATADVPFQYRLGPDAHIPGPPPNAPDYPGKHTYMDSLAFFLYNDHLSQGEKEQILGKTARQLHKWPTT